MRFGPIDPNRYRWNQSSRRISLEIARSACIFGVMNRPPGIATIAPPILLKFAPLAPMFDASLDAVDALLGESNELDGCCGIGIGVGGCSRAFTQWAPVL